MRGAKAKALRRAVAKATPSVREKVNGWWDITWHYSDANGTVRVGPCPRKLYLNAKKSYLKAKRGF